MGLFASCHQNLLNSRLGHSFCLFVCVLNLSSRQFRPNGTRAMNLLTWLLSWVSGIQIKLVSLKAKRAVISWTGKALKYLEEQINMSIMWLSSSIQWTMASTLRKFIFNMFGWIRSYSFVLLDFYNMMKSEINTSYCSFQLIIFKYFYLYNSRSRSSEYNESYISPDLSSLLFLVWSNILNATKTDEHIHATSCQSA